MDTNYNYVNSFTIYNEKFEPIFENVENTQFDTYDDYIVIVDKDGTKIVDKATVETVEKLDFKALRNEAQELWQKLVIKADGSIDEQTSTEILKKIEIQMGRKAKLSEITEDQVDILNLIVMDMREMAK